MACATESNENEHFFRDLKLFVKQAMLLSVWEPHWLSEPQRLGRMRANERRKKLLRELRANMAQTIMARCVGAN